MQYVGANITNLSALNASHGQPLEAILASGVCCISSCFRMRSVDKPTQPETINMLHTIKNRLRGHRRFCRMNENEAVRICL
jgi:7,8-dihydro-6-hydroxymethylpterin-pyrophosphokinase